MDAVATMTLPDESTADILTPRQYADRTGIHLQTAYERIWRKDVYAEQHLGRWLIFLPRPTQEPQQPADVQGEALQERG